MFAGEVAAGKCLLNALLRLFDGFFQLHGSSSTPVSYTHLILHLPAIAHEFGIEIDADTFERIHKSAHYLLDGRPAGRWPSEYVYYAGGVPAIMEEVRHLLHLDVMTVTGKTLGENLDLSLIHI